MVQYTSEGNIDENKLFQNFVARLISGVKSLTKYLQQ